MMNDQERERYRELLKKRMKLIRTQQPLSHRIWFEYLLLKDKLVDAALWFCIKCRKIKNALLGG